MCLVMPVYGQLAPIDKPIDIEQITVSTPRVQYVKIGNNVQVIDSMLLLRNGSSNLGDLLTGRSGLFIKSYGAAGSMSSVSFRGTGATHTALVWNGFPINSVTTGEIDLSLIPVFAANKISVIAGAPSTLFGSGTFGGSIELCSEPVWNKSFTVNALSEAGSFNSYANSLKFSTSNSRIFYSLAGIYQSADNDFDFIQHNTTTKLVHNAYKSSGILQQLAYKINSNNELQTAIWYQQKQKQLPLQIGQAGSSGADQNDSSLRMFATYISHLDGINVKAQSGLFYNYLHYTDNKTIPQTDSHIKSRQFMNQLEFRITRFEKLIIDVSAGYTLESARTQYYLSTIKEKQGVVSVAVNYPFSFITLNASARKDWMEHYAPKPQYAFGFKIPTFLSSIVLKGSISTRFRKPTFNERYWMPYGNVNIKPESGWGCESTLYIDEIKTSYTHLNTSITAYSNKINDWIQWIPMPAQMTQPVNYKSVWSRGFEIEQNVLFKVFELKNNIRAAYYYTRSTITSSYNPDYSISNMQLMYTPLHSAQGSWNMNYKNIDTELSTSYTGYRYVDELKNFLHGYAILNFSIGYTIQSYKYSIRLNFKSLNVNNTQYQVLNGYAMPGRSYLFSICLNFKSL